MGDSTQALCSNEEAVYVPIYKNEQHKHQSTSKVPLCLAFRYDPCPSLSTDHTHEEQKEQKTSLTLAYLLAAPHLSATHVRHHRSAIKIM